MADPRLRSDSSTEDDPLRVVRSGGRRSFALGLPRWSLPSSLAILLLGGLAAVYTSEQLTALTAVLIAGSALGLLLTWDWLRKRRLLATVLVLNLGLVLLYFWSLDESHHFEVRVSPGGFSASVDGDTTFLRLPASGHRFGLQAGSYDSYRIQATGEAIQSDTTSLFGRIAATMRLAEPASGWANLRLDGSGLDPLRTRLTGIAGSWSTNRRGEVQGSPSAIMLFAAPAHRSYVLSGDLRRPDGTQSVLLGVDRQGSGIALQLRFDQPDAIWMYWRNGIAIPISGPSGTGLHHLAFVAELQRVTRVVLTGYLFALLLAALAMGLYPALLSGFRLLPGASAREWTGLAALLRTRTFRWSYFTIATVAATVATALVSTYLLDRIPHVQDSVAYLFQAKIFAAGSLHAPTPPGFAMNFFQEPFVPYYQGKWFSQYPPGHSLMLMLGVLVGAPWLVEPVLASLSLGCVFFLGRRIYGVGVGALATLLGLSSPFWLFLGSEYMSHPTGLFLTVTFLLCFARLETGDPRRRWALLAGFLAGMLFITRELTAVGAVGPLLLYVLIFRRRSWRVYVPAMAGAALPLACLLLYNWAQMGSPFESTYLAWDRSFGIGFGNTSANHGDFTPADGVWNVYQNLAMLAPQLYGWPYGLALAFAFLPFVLGSARRWDYMLLSSFAGVAVAHAFYWAPGLMYGPRYYYETLPALLLLTARGIVELARLPCRLWPHWRLPRDVELGALFPAALVVSLLVFNLRFYLPSQMELYRGYNYSSAAELRAVDRAHIHHALVFVTADPYVAWTGYGNVFFANDPWLRGDIIYAQDQGPLDRRLFPYFPGRTHYRLSGTKLTRIT